MPKKIGVVTSSTGAAIRDIVSIIKRRYPPTNILIYPALVQGPDAPKEICKGLRYLDNLSDIDLIITGRGGGSIEELFAFNDEELARTIYNLKTPVISAVGHETDFTIADFVADLRAPTPSAAAELAVPDICYLVDKLNSKRSMLLNLYSKKIHSIKNSLKVIESSLNYNNPIHNVILKKQEMDGIFKDLNYLIDKKISNEFKKLVVIENKLINLNPNIHLEKGYGILYDENGVIIKSIDDLTINQEINIMLKDGKIRTKITYIEEGGVHFGHK
jgi:exodeoxyribonuclease VII large subunit